MRLDNDSRKVRKGTRVKYTWTEGDVMYGTVQDVMDNMLYVKWEAHPVESQGAVPIWAVTILDSK